MSGQRSADDAGDNLGNDGSNITNYRDIGHHHDHLNNNNNINNVNNNNVNGDHDGDVDENRNYHNHNLRRRNDSTASGMAGGCSMREGADSIELRGDNSNNTYSSNSMIRGSSSHHASSRPQRINHNNTTTSTTNANDGLAVFTWGRGEDGQLGLGDTADQDEPTYVRSFCSCFCAIFEVRSIITTDSLHVFFDFICVIRN
jgi:hypothetical protein